MLVDGFLSEEIFNGHMSVVQVSALSCVQSLICVMDCLAYELTNVSPITFVDDMVITLKLVQSFKTIKNYIIQSFGFKIQTR